MTIRVGGLFSGIGGLELGIEQGVPGASTAWQVEYDGYARGILEKRFPEALQMGDIREVDPTQLDPVHILTGGFPCQDLSTLNNKREGLNGKKSGLWSEYLRVLDGLRTSPEWVVVENVHQAWRGWVPVVRRALWARGYTSLPLRLSAAEVGAWHQRRRGFVVAHADSLKLRQLSGWWRGASGEVASELEQPGRWTPEPPVIGSAHGLPHRLDRQRCLGNAVVPAVARVLGHYIHRCGVGP